MSRNHALALSSLCLLTSCTSPAPPAGTLCQDEPDPLCGNAINRVVLPMLQQRGLPVRVADPFELCRRLGVDLLDRVPTPQEQAECIARPIGERIDAFMATDAYVRNERRLWASRVGYDVLLAHWSHIVEMDELARRVAAGEIDYPTFVGRIVVHPGFFGLHYDDDWARSVVRVALHRDARDDEIAALSPLNRAVSGVVFCDGVTYWMRTTVFGKEPGDPDGEYCDSYMPALDGCACAELGCKSTAFGGSIDFAVAPCANGESEYALENLYLMSAAGPDGTDLACPDGNEQIECADRQLDDETLEVGGPLPPIAHLDDAALARLGALGEVLAAQHELWEAAADRELERLLGWWKSGFKQPEWDLPAVRAVVAEELRRTGSLRAVHELILESVLYTAPSAPPATASEPPPWSMGPLKLMAGDAWLDSVGVVAGETVGRCDFRFLTSEDFPALVNVDPNVVDTVTTTLGDAFMGDDLALFGDGFRTAEMYERLARSLGGCINTSGRPLASSVGIVSAQRDLAQRVCAVGRAVLPDGVDAGDTSDAALDAVTGHLVRRALGRVPAEREVATFRGEMRACLDAGEGVGCSDLSSAARWLCQRIVDSAEFALY